MHRSTECWTFFGYIGMVSVGPHVVVVSLFPLCWPGPDVGAPYHVAEVGAVDQGILPHTGPDPLCQELLIVASSPMSTCLGTRLSF